MGLKFEYNAHQFELMNHMNGLLFFPIIYLSITVRVIECFDTGGVGPNHRYNADINLHIKSFSILNC